MPPKKRVASADAARLKVLASGDEGTFFSYLIEVLESGSRLARESALEALLERPQAAARDAVRRLYNELDADGTKHDQRAPMRGNIVRVLTALGDVRDRDIAVRATDTHESIMGEDLTYELRTLGLKLLFQTDPDLFPYVAIEHLDDFRDFTPEPANTAIQLLASNGNLVPIYQWLISGERPNELIGPAIELLRDAPREVVRRYVASTGESAIRRSDEQLLTSLAEAIVGMELDDAYPALNDMMSAKISDELHGYLAVLLAGTNRPALLAILEEQLHGIRRREAIVAALRIRTTPEQAAILARWEAGGA